jgi:predicted nucleic acid-binding protein
MKKFIFDTNVYDYIIDHRLDISFLLSKGEFYTTNIQVSEIKNITASVRRDQIIAVYEKLNPKKLSLESGVWLNDLYWDNTEIWNNNVSETYNELKGNSIKNNNLKDALTGDVAKKHELILITYDEKFSKRAYKTQIPTMTIDELLKL